MGTEGEKKGCQVFFCRSSFPKHTLGVLSVSHWEMIHIYIEQIEMSKSFTEDEF